MQKLEQLASQIHTSNEGFQKATPASPGSTMAEKSGAADEKQSMVTARITDRNHEHRELPDLHQITTMESKAQDRARA
jgi:hypothetical protein